MTGRQRPYLAPEMHATYIYVIKVKGGGGNGQKGENSRLPFSSQNNMESSFWKPATY